MSVLPRDLWSLTFGQPQIDPADLASAVEAEACRDTLAPQLDMSEITGRLRAAGKSLMSNEKLAGHARKNWYILFGDDLPVEAG